MKSPAFTGIGATGTTTRSSAASGVKGVITCVSPFLSRLIHPPTAASASMKLPTLGGTNADAWMASICPQFPSRLVRLNSAPLGRMPMILPPDLEALTCKPVCSGGADIPLALGFGLSLAPLATRNHLVQYEGRNCVWSAS
ncbi:hypothetical protein D3C87_1590110 [compost metagenome]